MPKYPGQSVTIEWDHRQKSNNALTDATTVDIVVKDPSNVTRIAYDAALLANPSIGQYTYTFTVPDAVLPGNWYAEITAGIIPDIDVKRGVFPVEE